MSSDLDGALASLQRGDFDAALVVLSRMVAEAPDEWNAHYLAGFAYRAKGDFKNAARCYERALELSPDEPNVLLAAGIVEQQTGRLEEAVALLRRAVQANPDFVEAHNSLGLTLKMMGRTAEALEAYGQAADALMGAIIGRIAASEDREKYMSETVQEDGSRGMELNPAIWGRVHRELKSNPVYATLQNNMGACFAALGDVQQARARFKESIEFIPDGMSYEAPRIGLRELGRG